MKLLLAIILLSQFIYATNNQYERGQKIYEKACQSCHGVKGDANSDVHFIVNPRDLSKTILSEEQTYKIIKKGSHFHGAFADMMPSFESVYNEKELRDVTHYIIKAFNPKSQRRVNELYSQADKIDHTLQAKMLKRGKKIYKRNCFWCHGPEGKGDGEATRNPEMSIFPYNLRKTLLDEKQMFAYVKYGGKYWGAYTNDMPSWSPKYDDFTIKSIIKYINKDLKKIK